MKVATLWFDRTRHFHWRTLNSSGATSIATSCFTLTWHERRTPSRSSPRVRWLRSVGRTAPPPSSTLSVQTPQLPLPPHADGMKRPFAASVPSSVPPAGVQMSCSGSSLMRIVTSPVATSRFRA